MSVHVVHASGFDFEPRTGRTREFVTDGMPWVVIAKDTSFNPRIPMCINIHNVDNKTDRSVTKKINISRMLSAREFVRAPGTISSSQRVGGCWSDVPKGSYVMVDKEDRSRHQVKLYKPDSTAAARKFDENADKREEMRESLKKSTKVSPDFYKQNMTV